MPAQRIERHGEAVCWNDGHGLNREGTVFAFSRDGLREM
jgi:hypothetical protein